MSHTFAMVKPGQGTEAEPSISQQFDISGIELLLALDEPVALIDPGCTKLVWVSARWLDSFPQLLAGTQWCNCTASVPELAKAVSFVKEQGIGSQNTAGMSSPGTQIRSHNSSLEFAWQSGRPGDIFKFTQIGAQGWLLRLEQLPDMSKPLQGYLQSLDGLFSTSRTISVSEMATTLAHEINQPVGTITNLIRGLQARQARDVLTPEDLQRALEQALEQALFTSSVISRIRDYTQARRPDWKSLNAHALMRNAVSLLGWMLETNRCTVQWQLSQEELAIKGDKTMLQQVVLNLMRNAIEAMVDIDVTKRVIVISTSVIRERARLMVSDAGIGLLDQAELFVPFSTQKPGGMGVGLNICRSFVELHQGRLWLSPNEQGGCTATIELPLADVQASSL